LTRYAFGLTWCNPCWGSMLFVMLL